MLPEMPQDGWNVVCSACGVWLLFCFKAGIRYVKFYIGKINVPDSCYSHKKISHFTGIGRCEAFQAADVDKIFLCHQPEAFEIRMSPRFFYSTH
jgi:hypothetical protein